MQNLEAVASQLGKISAAFKDGGLYFLIGVIAFLVFLAVREAMKRQAKKQPSSSIDIKVGSNGNGNGKGNVCPAHSGIEAKIEAFEDFRKENREEHKQLFAAIEGLRKA